MVRTRLSVSSSSAAMKEQANDLKAAARNASRADKAALASYALDGEIVCFVQSAEKFKARYATFGFSDQATLVTHAVR